ncbi:MAG: hypothetical protein Q8K58_12045 [Acidimicrobiales bacterium]|nr:hypothetical protein [Acidimicrobiales bacterium]
MPAVVVNVLHFKKSVDLALFEKAEDELGRAMRDIDGFRGLQVVQTGEAEVVLLIFGESADALDRIATEVGSPWMAANVVPLLAGPPERRVGALIASAASG